MADDLKRKADDQGDQPTKMHKVAVDSYEPRLVSCVLGCEPKIRAGELGLRVGPLTRCQFLICSECHLGFKEPENCNPDEYVMVKVWAGCVTESDVDIDQVKTNLFLHAACYKANPKALFDGANDYYVCPKIIYTKPWFFVVRANEDFDFVLKPDEHEPVKPYYDAVAAKIAPALKDALSLSTDQFADFVMRRLNIAHSTHRYVELMQGSTNGPFGKMIESLRNYSSPPNMYPTELPPLVVSTQFATDHSWTWQRYCHSIRFDSEYNVDVSALFLAIADAAEAHVEFLMSLKREIGEDVKSLFNVDSVALEAAARADRLKECLEYIVEICDEYKEFGLFHKIQVKQKRNEFGRQETEIFVTKLFSDDVKLDPKPTISMPHSGRLAYYPDWF